MRSLSGPAVVVGSLVWILLPFLIFLKTCEVIQFKKKYVHIYGIYSRARVGLECYTQDMV